MKKLLKTRILFIAVLLFITTTASAQETKTNKVMVNKEVEMVDGKEMVTLTITKESDGKVTVIDTTFESTGEENINAILKSYGISTPINNSVEGEKVMIKKLAIDTTNKKMIFRSDEEMDVQMEVIGGKHIIKTIKDGDTMVNEMIIDDKRIVFDNEEIYLGDSLKDGNVRVMKWKGKEGADTNIVMEKRVIIVFKANVTDLNDVELSQLITDKVLTKKAQPMEEVEVSAYPNPTTGSLNVSFTLETEGDTEVKLINSAGKTVYTENLDDFKGIYSKGIDLASNTKGVYYLVVLQGKKVLTKKIVLQ